MQSVRPTGGATYGRHAGPVWPRPENSSVIRLLCVLFSSYLYISHWTTELLRYLPHTVRISNVFRPPLMNNVNGIWPICHRLLRCCYQRKLLFRTRHHYSSIHFCHYRVFYRIIYQYSSQKCFNHVE